MGRNLTFGVAYTWAKVLGVATDDGTFVKPFNNRAADYGPVFFHRTHNLVFKHVYSLPKLVKGNSALSNVAKVVANNWQISGITTMVTGQPDNIGFSIDGLSNLNERFTGSANVGPRVRLTGAPSYPKEQYSYINTSIFALPTLQRSKGFDSAPRLIRRPGDNN